MVNSSKDYSDDPLVDLVAVLLSLRPLYLKIPPFRDIRTMTYEDAINYFVQNQPPLPFKKGAMIIERGDEENYSFFTQIFLNDENNVVCDPVYGKPYGRRSLIRGIDDELAALFGANQIVFVE